jgi:uncharacterized protein YjlB
MKKQAAKAVEAFLMAEGWKKWFIRAAGLYLWKDPLWGHGYNKVWAYRKAKERKAARERRALRKAGWTRIWKGWIRPYSYLSGLSRGEAVKALSQGKKRKGR